MTIRGELEQAQTEARERLAIAIGVALLIAGVALLVAVLPAEFGVDPTGLGRRLGLMALADMKTQVAAFEDGAGPAGAAQTVVASAKSLQQETVEFALAPGEFVEYKYRLEKGESLLYTWHASTAVNVEFHAEPDGAPKGYAESYEKQSRVQGGSGTLHAPFAGIHGWFWENASQTPATVTLKSSGFYTLAHEFRKDQPTTTKMFH